MKIHLVGDWDSRKILLNGKILNPQKSQKIRNHSPDGFNWGYGGSGPAQLALAILLQFMDEQKALKHYQNFKFKVISRLPQNNFDTEIDITEWINEKED